jgi:hypothetical protein
MDSEKKTELTIKVASSILTLATVLIGIWQFNAGQREIKEREIEQRNFELSKMNNQATIEVLLRFKEIQTKQYIEATSVISYLTVNEDFFSKEYKNKLNRFWQLYWVELSAIETGDVERAMIKFGTMLQALQENNFKDFKDKHIELKSASYEIAQAIKKSANSWELPQSMKK